MSDLAFADDIIILSSSYSEMQGMFEAVNHPAAAVGMRINASKTKVTSALIPGEQRQNKFEYTRSMFFTNSPGAEKFRSRINFACSTFSSLQSCL